MERERHRAAPPAVRAITTAAQTPQYAACYADEHAGLGVAGTTRVAAATAGMVAPDGVAAFAGVASAPS